MIGVSFDGTGYGTDGTIWGGEILTADCQGFTRFGSIEPFVQVGGDISAKEGWRIAVSLIWQNTGDLERTLNTVRKLGLCTDQEAKVLVTMAQRKINAVTSTSAGRLFDGVSAILGSGERPPLREKRPQHWNLRRRPGESSGRCREKSGRKSEDTDVRKGRHSGRHRHLRSV